MLARRYSTRAWPIGRRRLAACGISLEYGRDERSRRGPAGAGLGNAVICPNCQTDNPEAARVCRACAQLLDGPTLNLPAQPNSPYAQRSRRLTQLIIIGTVGLLLFFCVVLALSAIPPR